LALRRALAITDASFAIRDRIEARHRRHPMTYPSQENDTIRSRLNPSK
jgi:hypothetical protein